MAFDVRHPALVIGGMHRSGTSLVASLLATAGVDIGRDLMGPERGNEKGHFEDLDFYRFHQRVLTANGLGTEGYTCLTAIEVPTALHVEAAELVDSRRRLGRLWGWKDPRVTLFLDFWDAMLPEAGYVFVFRRPWEVVDSLLRRGDPAFVIHPRRAIDVWLAYNQRVRDFFLSHRTQSVLVETSAVVRDPEGFVALVAAMLGMPLDPPKNPYEPGLLVEDHSSDRAHIVSSVRAEAVDLYLELRRLAGAESPPDVLARPTGPDELFSAAMAQWGRAARAEEIGRSRKAEIDAAAGSLAAITARHSVERAEQESLRREATRRLDAAAEEIASLQGRLEAVARDNASLMERLAIARRKKTVGERLTIESRRIVRQALDLVGLAWRITLPGR